METATQTEVKSVIAGKFNGSLSRFQLGAFNDLIWCKVDRGTAHKIASDFGSDLGRLMSTDAEFAAKVSKADKNGNSKIALSGGGKVGTTRTMSIVRLSQQMYNLYKEGLISDRELPRMTSSLTEYFNECEEWAKEQTWQD